MILFYFTGTSWDGSKIRTRSGTHNTGAGAHCDQDRYTPDGSRKAGPVEQDMIQDMYKNGRGTGMYNVNSLTQRQALWRCFLCRCSCRTNSTSRILGKRVQYSKNIYIDRYAYLKTCQRFLWNRLHINIKKGKP